MACTFTACTWWLNMGVKHAPYNYSVWFVWWYSLAFPYQVVSDHWSQHLLPIRFSHTSVVFVGCVYRCNWCVMCVSMCVMCVVCACMWCVWSVHVCSVWSMQNSRFLSLAENEIFKSETIFFIPRRTGCMFLNILWQ